eukprot:8431102-Pyramimonas_sp.AAC.1
MRGSAIEWGGRVSDASLTRRIAYAPSSHAIGSGRGHMLPPLTRLARCFLCYCRELRGEHASVPVVLQLRSQGVLIICEFLPPLIGQFGRLVFVRHARLAHRLLSIHAN